MKRTRGNRWSAAAVVVAVVLVGCGGDDSTAPGSTDAGETLPPLTEVATTEPAPSVAVETTAAPTSPPTTAVETSTTPVATSPPTTTVQFVRPSTTTSSTTSTVPPSSTSTTAPASTTTTTVFATPPTIYAPDDPRAEVEAAVIATDLAWIGCAASLPECPIEVLSDAFTAPALETSTQLISTLNENGYQTSRTNEFRLRIFEIALDDGSAVVSACKFDPVYVFRPDPNGGPDDVFSDSVTSRLVNITMIRNEDGRWRQSFTERLDQVDGDGLCPP